ncbi:AmmeMemoRadiSam system protein A, partial [Acidobacteria bacterium AH-259-L09]|nr:AmmeMemoRadiSam system protein A [Acidobacteria bacterium AH-259-L09]
MSKNHKTARAERGRPPGLSAENKETLLRLARQTLNDYLGEGKLPQSQTDLEGLLQPQATFITLRRRDSGELRGCRGERLALRPLVESVANMVVAAATDDQRFAPVRIDEVPDLRIEISVLTPMKPMQPEEVVVGRHGLMITKGHNSGLLLPQVPRTYGWDREEFLGGLCRKAGLSEN